VEFQQLYKSALDVLWRWILSRTFRTQREAENAAAQLMSFAGCSFLSIIHLHNH
ncbi:DUF1367 family protein, partial [Salmonella enterica]|uniref:DUF1367 family protein n=1 Tax=Salmonella enterica TaxID=28901 RepID=UPI0011BF432D